MSVQSTFQLDGDLTIKNTYRFSVCSLHRGLVNQREVKVKREIWQVKSLKAKKERKRI